MTDTTHPPYSQVSPGMARPSIPCARQSVPVSAPMNPADMVIACIEGSFVPDSSTAANSDGQSERDLFESEVRDLFNNDVNFSRNEGGEYIDTQTLDMWIGWGMRAAISKHSSTAKNAGDQA